MRRSSGSFSEIRGVCARVCSTWAGVAATVPGNGDALLAVEGEGGEDAFKTHGQEEESEAGDGAVALPAVVVGDEADDQADDVKDGRCDEDAEPALTENGGDDSAA